MKLLFGLSVALHLFHLGQTCSVDDPATVEAAFKTLAKRVSKGPPKKTVINNIKFFDGISFTPPKTIVLNNGVITYVGPAKQTDAVVTVDGTGKFLIPGLIDSHCHVSNTDQLDLMASYGVTTAVNMACYNYTLCAALGKVEGTSSFISASVPAVGTGSAHAELAASAHAPANETLSTGDNTTAWVENYAFPKGTPSGFLPGFLKAVAEPGGPDQEILSGVVATARQMGHYTAMHASYLSAYEQAVIARPLAIQHLPEDQLLNSSMAQTILKQGQFVTPTLNIFRTAYNSPELSQKLNAHINWTIITSNAQTLKNAGVPFVAGTDAATFSNFTMAYGLSLHCELEFLVNGAGLTPADALRAATTRAARLGGWTARGMIAPGKRADLLLLDANPLANISNSRSVDRVWTGGIEFTGVKKDMKSQCMQINIIQT